MADYGFIYCLTNQYMPGICKIGYTDRAPSQRCRELSSSTSAPFDFDLMFYVELEGASTVEREIHAALDGQRINPGREFFSCTPAEAYQWLRRHSDVATDYLDGDTLLEFSQLEEAGRIARTTIEKAVSQREDV